MQSLTETWQFWLGVAVRLVGMTFVWAGTIKAIAPRNFHTHMRTLGLLPVNWLDWTVAAVAGIEIGLGAALVLGIAWKLILPATVVLLVVLTGVSLWGVKSGRTADCGCYGGYIQPSIWQSVGLNGAFAIILLAGAMCLHGPDDASAWKITLASLLGVSGIALVIIGQLYERNHGRPLIETNPLKLGAKWRRSWSGGLRLPDGEESMVVFLGVDCPFCHQWIRFLNAIAASPSLPAVLGAMGASKNRRDAFIKEQRIKFPTVTISPSLVSRLAPGVPTTVLVVNGRVQEIWMGAMPPAFYNRFKEAFFPGQVTPALAQDAVTS